MAVIAQAAERCSKLGWEPAEFLGSGFCLTHSVGGWRSVVALGTRTSCFPPCLPCAPAPWLFTGVYSLLEPPSINKSLLPGLMKG